jgi:hypothetical protein
MPTSTRPFTRGCGTSRHPAATEDVDDLGAHQGQQGAGDAPGAEQVELQRCLDDGEVGGGRLLTGVGVDGGAVDQDVDPPGPLRAAGVS